MGYKFPLGMIANVTRRAEGGPLGGIPKIGHAIFGFLFVTRQDAKRCPGQNQTVRAHPLFMGPMTHHTPNALANLKGIMLDGILFNVHRMARQASLCLLRVP